MHNPFRSLYNYLHTLSITQKQSIVKDNGGWYGTNDFRHEVVKDLILHKGELIFFEIVGYVNSGFTCREHEYLDNFPQEGLIAGPQAGCSKCSPATPIMPPHDVTKTGLKEIQKKYGDTINYTYACPKGTRRIYVYKIAHVNEDGKMVELAWPAMVGRCLELGLAHVPLLFGPTTLSHLAHIHSTGGHEALRRTVESLCEGESTLNSAQIREGVVVRVESKDGVAQLKQKQFVFGVLEGYLSEDESFVDPEDSDATNHVHLYSVPNNKSDFGFFKGDDKVATPKRSQNDNVSSLGFIQLWAQEIASGRSCSTSSRKRKGMKEKKQTDTKILT